MKVLFSFVIFVIPHSVFSFIQFYSKRYDNYRVFIVLDIPIKIMILEKQNNQSKPNTNDLFYVLVGSHFVFL